MRLELRVAIEADGLVGGAVESASHVGVWTSWALARRPQRVPLQKAPGSVARYEMDKGAVLGPYVLNLAELRLDESVWLHLISKTDFADVASIDKEEAGLAPRNQQSGSVQVTLAEILAAVDPATRTGTVAAKDLMDTNFVAKRLMEARVKGQAPNLDAVFDAAHKARATLHVTVADVDTDALVAAAKLLTKMQTAGGTPLGENTRVRFDSFASAVQAVLVRTVPVDASAAAAARRSASKTSTSARFGAGDAPPLAAASALDAPVTNPVTGKLLYVPANYRRFMAALDTFVEIYAKKYIGVIDPATGELKGPPQFDTPNKGLQGLHFAVYRAMVGMLPVIAFWAHAPEHRPYAAQAERDEAVRLHGATDATERFYETMMRASNRRFGISDDRFVRAIAEQYDRVDARVLDDYIFSKCAIADACTFVANAAYYTNDSRYPNPHRAVPADERADAQKAAETALAEAHKHGEKLDVKVAVPNLNAAESLESFDQVVMMFLSASADCEDVGNVSSSVGRLLRFGRLDRKDGVWDSPLLAAAQRVLRDHAFLDTGGDVTAAYYGSDGQEMKKNEIKDLPRRGSPEDARNGTGGHAYALMPPLARCAVWQTRGGLTGTPLHARVRGMAPWQARQPTLVLEGTGPIDHLLLPAAEVFGPDSPHTRKAEAARHLVRDVLAGDAWKGLTDAFRPYSTPFYSRRVEPDRRVTGFYRNSVHAGSVELYELHAGMSQVAFVNPKTSQRGIDTVEILRDSLRDPADVGTSGEVVALDVPFYAHAAEWKRTMVPVMEAMANQMPVTGLARIAEQHVLQPLHFTLLSEGALAARLGAGAGTALKALAIAAGADALACGACGGDPEKKKKKKTKANSGVRALAGHAHARIGSIHEEAPAALPAAAVTEAALRAHSSLGVAWADAVAKAPPTGTLAWDRVLACVNMASFVPPPLATGAAAEANALQASIVQFKAAALLTGARGAELAAARSWDALTGGTEQWTRVPAVGKSAFSVVSAHLEPRSGGAVAVQLTVAEDLRTPRDPAMLTMVHLRALGRVYALEPIIVAAGPRAALSAPPVVYHRRTFLLDAARVAQAFCTQEPLVAAPWITLEHDMPAATGAPALSMLPALVALDMGAPECQPALAPFHDCHARTDAVLVRFVGRDWAVKKHWDEAMACIKRLYADGTALAHEFVLSTPLPQSSPVAELHLLIKA